MYNYHHIVLIRRIIIIAMIAVNLSLTTIKLLMCFTKAELFRPLGWNDNTVFSITDLRE